MHMLYNSISYEPALLYELMKETQCSPDSFSQIYTFSIRTLINHSLSEVLLLHYMSYVQF